VFEGLAACDTRTVHVGPPESAEPVTAAAVTPDFFSLLGVEPVLGRGFLSEEGRPGAGPVVVLDHGYWQRHFGGARDVLGETLTIDGETRTIVGVMPERFEFLDPQIELWQPLAIDPAAAREAPQGVLVVGRLAPGVSTAEADAAMKTIGEGLESDDPEAYRGLTTQVLNLRYNVPSTQDRTLLGLIQGALVFVLLIACANVANLLLARTQGRVTELAVRSSLGAGRWRIARQLTIEALVAAGLGGLLGLGGGVLATGAVANAFAARLPSFWLPTVDLHVVLFTAGITVAAGVLVGLLPAFQAARLNVQTALKEGGRSVGLGGRRRLMTKALVVAEIALTLILLGGGSVLIVSFLDIQTRDPGFETAHLATVRVTLPEARYDTPGERATAYREIVQRLAALPGVTGATTSEVRPRTPILPSQPFTIDGAETPEGQAPPSAAVMAVGPEFFDTIGVPLLTGRGFQETDAPGTAPVAMVNRSFAENHWQGGDPLGHRITVRGESRRVVGVVEDAIHGVFFDRGAQPAIYLPLTQTAPAAAAVTLVAADPGTLGNPVREALIAYDRGLGLSEVQPLDAYTAQFFVGMQIIATILSGFGMLGLLLAALGTYGVLAYSVAQRTHEIGVRMALGAESGKLRRMITRQGLVLAGIGIAIGVPGVILVTRTIGSAVADLAGVEPMTVLAVVVVLAVVTLLASWIPARRAAKVDPLVALRDE
jgi:putative ABC transport system permease protein